MHPKGGIGQHGLDDAVDLYRLFLGHHAALRVAGKSADPSRITSRATAPAPHSRTSNPTAAPAASAFYTLPRIGEWCTTQSASTCSRPITPHPRDRADH